MRRRSRSVLADRQVRVLHQVAAWCLAYPDDDLLERLPLLERALAEVGGAEADGLRALVGHLGSTPLEELQASYVAVFDLDRSHALHLSYWTDGDTRRRGETLGRFKQAYRDSGFVVDTGGELPDHLCMVLEFAAVADPAAGRALLREFRASLELIRFALLDADSPYAAALVAVSSTLPGPAPATRAEAMAMAAPPPAEAVGLEPYDPRLLPVLGGQAPHHPGQEVLR